MTGRSNYFIFKICFFTGLITSGCYLTDEIDIEMPDQVKDIVVEGYLTPGSPVEISVSRNNLMDEELILKSIWNARVIITDKTDTLNLLNIFYRNRSRNILVNYLNESLPGILKGNVLHLRIITKGGDTLLANTQIVAPIKILNAGIENKYLHLTKVIFDGGFTGYLRVDVTSYDGDTVSYYRSDYLNLRESPSDEIQIPLSVKMTNYDSVLVKTFHITEEYYKYAVSVSNALNAYYDPFLIPEEIRSNIKNGIGIFTFYTTDSKIIYYSKLKK